MCTVGLPSATVLYAGGAPLLVLALAWGPCSVPASPSPCCRCCPAPAEPLWARCLAVVAQRSPCSRLAVPTTSTGSRGTHGPRWVWPQGRAECVGLQQLTNALLKDFIPSRRAPQQGGLALCPQPAACGTIAAMSRCSRNLLHHAALRVWPTTCQAMLPAACA